MIIHQKLESFLKGGNLIISIPLEKYEKTLMEILKFLLNKKKLKGILVSVNKPSDVIISMLKANKIDFSKLTIIDCVSSTVEKRKGNQIYLKRPFNPTDVSIELDALTKKTENQFVVFDTLTTILSYNGMTIIRFFQHVLSDLLMKHKLTIILGIDVDPNDIRIKLITQFCNQFIKI